MRSPPELFSGGERIALTGDGELAALAEEIASYPIPAGEPGGDVA